MTQRLLIILGLFCLFSVVQAQDDPLPVLYAEDIFADGISVLERLPVIEFDRINRQIYYFNPDMLNWSSYPYPILAERGFNLYRERSDGQYLLRRGNDDNGRLSSYDSDWLFDPLTGAFSRDNLTCGRITATLDDGEWFVHQLDSGLYVLCDTATGEQIPLPNDIQSECGNYPEISTESPNREWVVFHTCGNSSPLQFYAMNTSSQLVNYLGGISFNAYPYWLWINNDLLLIELPLNIFNTFFDQGFMRPSQANSLTYIGINRDIDLSRSNIVWDEVSLADDGECNNTVYVLDTQSYEKTIIYEENHEDGLGCLIGGRVAVSPSQRYLALGSDLVGGADFGGRNIFIIWDTETQEIIYEHEAFPDIRDMHWIDDERVIFNYDTRYEDQVERSTIAVLDIIEISPTITVLEPESIYQRLFMSPNNEAIILRNDAYESYIYYFPTQQTFSIFQSNVYGYITWDRSSENLNLIAATSCFEIPCDTRWHIQIDAINELDT